MTQKRIRIDDIKIDGSTQLREWVNELDVNELVDHYKSGRETPPPVVYFDGTHYWLGDGHHRVAGHRKAGRDSIVVEVEPGTQRDAILYAAGANSDHGVRRTIGDKRKAVTALLKDAEWGQWSDRAIAEKCRVSHPLVASIRSQLVATGRTSTPPQKSRVSADGIRRPATQPTPTVKPADRLCDRCQRIGKPLAGCVRCAELRGGKPASLAFPESDARSPVRTNGAMTIRCPSCGFEGCVPGEAAKKPPKSSEPSVVIPGAIDTPEFRKAWEAWLDYKRERKDKFVPASQEKSLAQLAKVGTAKAIETIDRSIEKGWMGLFPEDENGKGKTRSAGSMGPGRIAIDAEALQQNRERRAAQQIALGDAGGGETPTDPAA